MRRVLPTTVPRLERPPCLLRPFEAKDHGMVASAASDPLIPLITTVPASGRADEVAAYIQRQHDRLSEGAGYSFAIADSTTDKAVGQIGLWTREVQLGRASVGYWVVSGFRRRGYARAALATLTQWASTLDGIYRLQLFIEPWNEGSWRAAEACGYEREGLLRGWERVGDEYRDMYAYSRPGLDRRAPTACTQSRPWESSARTSLLPTADRAKLIHSGENDNGQFYEGAHHEESRAAHA